MNFLYLLFAVVCVDFVQSSSSLMDYLNQKIKNKKDLNFDIGRISNNRPNYQLRYPGGKARKHRGHHRGGDKFRQVITNRIDVRNPLLDDVRGDDVRASEIVELDPNTLVMSATFFNSDHSHNNLRGILNFEIGDFPRRQNHKKLIKAEIMVEFEIFTRNQNIEIMTRLESLTSPSQIVTGISTSVTSSVNFDDNKTKFQRRRQPRISRHMYDVTKFSQNDDVILNNIFNNDGELATLASWRLPSLTIVASCRRGNKIVNCKRRGVHFRGNPFLVLTIA